ncbi:hypothetical protein OBBRIDRAFT_585237 [Obba rivulosa]|uniref:Uncharacterized protein n=1 Tax=Obba rivulosa TaxID=1052685 RepID=A0A8E2DJP4_9APHY|nr:hypothetical protein OBBRIDRAFT_585237 [Obba rivulosa]
MVSPTATVAASTSVDATTAQLSAGDSMHTAQSSSSQRHKGKRKATDADNANTSSDATKAAEPQHKIRKLVPPRPWPSVPASVSATGPRSAHSEGKNYICITRKTNLGAYLRRCKDVVMKDGYKTLHLSAMGAAIPHLVRLAISIPATLPFGADEIRTEYFTGTVAVQDELVPADEDEDIEYRTRGKSSLLVVMTIGDGVDEARPTRAKKGAQAQATAGVAGGNFAAARAGKRKQRAPGHNNEQPEQIVYREEDLED